MRITFLGAAREVTGSCTLVETQCLSFLVDCGMFQGADAGERNRRALTRSLSDVAFVLLTHAHIDHSGLLPRLVQLGFKGPIHTTAATRDLLEVMLADSASIQEKDAERSGDAPLYTVTQALASLRQVRTIGYDDMIEPAPGVRCRFRDAGHILGAASIEISIDEAGAQRKLVFSGDLGQPGRPLVRDPAAIDGADVLVMESTYGNRLHKSLDATVDELCGAITQALSDRRGNALIPSFAVGRTQEVLYLLIRLVREKRLPDIDIVVDSPLATKATQVTLKHWRLLDPDVAPTFEAAMRAGGRPRIRFTESVEESAALSRVRDGALIIAGSGMCDGGRIQFHLRENLPRRESAVIIIGFQVQGTLGRRLVDGASSVRIFGDEVPVRASLHTIGGLSAHADQAGLLHWLRAFQSPPRRTFLVHGEAQAAEDFAAAIERKLGWRCELPAAGATMEL
ncbi:MAG TPA: MBL fold metallo-hydrolase [Burkholderiales bacterium]|nr:MBL fold metallo-hydrolase [Burkholderiales bacterium]